jgi:hypothetical protein
MIQKSKPEDIMLARLLYLCSDLRLAAYLVSAGLTPRSAIAAKSPGRTKASVYKP